MIMTYIKKRTEKLLQHQNFNKEFCIWGDYDNEIMDCVHKIKHFPLKKLCFNDIGAITVHNIFCTFENLSAHLKNLVLILDGINAGTADAIIGLIPSLVSLSLQYCEIQSTELIAIIDSIKQSGLQTLNLEAIRIEENTTKALIDCIKCSRLSSFSLGSCSFDASNAFESNSDAEQARAQSQSHLASIINSIVHSHSLQILFLDGITFDIEEMAAISNCIKNSSLTTLSLRACTFFDDKIITIVEAVQQSLIRTLVLDDSFFCDNITDVTTCIEKSCVTKFIFGDRKRQYDCAEMITIANLMRTNTLLSFGLYRATIDDDALSIMCDAISVSTLTTIKISDCNLSGPQIICICDSIAKSHVTSLDLSAGHFDITSITAVCYLIANSNLKKLKLRSCELTDEFVGIMLESIRESELIKFDINYNFELTKDVKRATKLLLKAQKRNATTFHKTKSSHTNREYYWRLVVQKN